jgi:hypothetical protein
LVEKGQNRVAKNKYIIVIIEKTHQYITILKSFDAGYPKKIKK